MSLCDGEPPCGDCWGCFAAWAFALMDEHPADSYGDPGSLADFYEEGRRLILRDRGVGNLETVCPTWDCRVHEGGDKPCGKKEASEPDHDIVVRAARGKMGDS